MLCSAALQAAEIRQILLLWVQQYLETLQQDPSEPGKQGPTGAPSAAFSTGSSDNFRVV